LCGPPRRSRPRRPKPSCSKPELPNLHAWLIKKHDVVEVNQGPEEGKRGLVLDRQWRENTLTVAGVQVKVADEIDPDSASIFNPSWVAKEEPQPLHLSHVSLIDPTTNTRADDVVWRKRDGRMARVALASGAMVPLPTMPADDDLVPREYAEDTVTRRSDVLEVTFVPLPEYSMKKAKQAERLGLEADSPPPPTEEQAKEGSL